MKRRPWPIRFMPFVDASGEIAYRLEAGRWFRFRAWLRSFFRPAYVRDAWSFKELERAIAGGPKPPRC